MPGGPCMLRNSEYVLGLPDVKNAADQQKISEGNGMMRFAADVQGPLELLVVMT